MDNSKDDGELPLRNHIRKLLFHYSLTHLTINYVTYTRSRVSELLSEFLSLVPITDPTSITLPLDPFEILSRSLRSRKLQQYDQRCTVNAESNAFLKSFLTAGIRRTRAHRCWLADGGDELLYTNLARPMSPILTHCAMRQTPRFGAARLRPSSSLRRFIENENFVPVHDEPVSEPEIPARDADDILGLRLKMDGNLYKEMISMLRESFRPQDQNTAQTKLRSISTIHDGMNTPPCSQVEHGLSPPVFPRRAVEHIPHIFDKFSDMTTQKVIANANIEEEEDLSVANMLLVGGENIIAPFVSSQSSSDTPPLDPASESSSTRADELFALTSPQTNSTPDVKMEEYLIPQTDNPRCGHQDKQAEQTLANFLPSLLPERLLPDSDGCQTFPTGPNTSTSARGLSLSPNLSAGTLGFRNQQHTSVRNTMHDDEDPVLDSLVAKLCKSVEKQPPEDLILKEKADEKETMMMDVPNMKEPHDHPSSPSCPTIPTSLRNLIAKEDPSDGISTFDLKPTLSHYKRVSGLRSLNIELTWRPFKFGSSVPRVEDLAVVESLPTLEDHGNHEFGKEVTKLLDKLEKKPIERGELNVLTELPIDWTSVVGKNSYTGEAILTRAERRRLAASRGNHVEISDDDSNVTEVGNHDDSMHVHESEGVTDRPSKRRKLDRKNLSTSDIPTVPQVFSPNATTNTSLRNSESGDHQILQRRGNAVTGPSLFNAASTLGIRSQPPAKVSIKPLANPLSLETSTSPHGRVTSLAISTVTIDLGKREIMPHQDATTPRNMETTARKSLVTFMNVRGKTVRESAPLTPSPIDSAPVHQTPPSSPKHSLPQELEDAHTLSIPEVWTPPTSRRRCIASLDLIQKRALVKRLCSEDCCIDLVEREMNVVDLITDVDTALFFVPLSPLAATCEALADRIAAASWDFHRLVVIFEGFLTSLAYLTPSVPDLAPNPYSPAAVKSIKRLKRILKISEAMETPKKRGSTAVWYGYANDVDEAAKFARVVAETPIQGMLDSDDSEREWLVDDPDLDEVVLARIKGMNSFAARMILHCMDLNAFLDLDPAHRLQMFSGIVGEQRMIIVNEEIARRFADVALSSSPSAIHRLEVPNLPSTLPEDHFVDFERQGVILREEDMQSDYYYDVDALREGGMDWQHAGQMIFPG